MQEIKKLSHLEIRPLYSKNVLVRSFLNLLKITQRKNRNWEIQKPSRIAQGSYLHSLKSDGSQFG